MTIGLGRYGGGVLRLARPGVLLHFCEGCNERHEIDVHGISQNGKVIGFDGDVIRPTIGEPVLHEKDGTVCEYMLRAGVLHYFQNCTHRFAGLARPLKECP
jgi:hypothetical protein